MNREASRKSQPGTGEAGWIALGGLLVLMVLVVMAIWVGAQTNPGTEKLPASDPVSIMGALLDGTLVPTSAQIGATLGLLIVPAGVGALLVVVALRQRRTRSRVDYKARSMAQKRDLIDLFEEAAEKDAQRLGARQAGPGVPLATTVALPGGKLYASWEWVQIWLMGPRAGKTTCVCVPQIIQTEGPVLATSNKRDIVDLSRGPRSQKGVIWVHDVQDIIGEASSWWWNPLTFVTDMETAEKMADIFITSATAAGAKQDAYFESAGKETLSRLLLAAALGDLSISEVFRWANNPDPDSTVGALDPAEILALHGQFDQGEALRSTQTLTEKQRDGVYGTIRPWIGVLGSDKVLPWITDNGSKRPHFDPEAFVRSTDTIYLISKEGGGSARAITGALTMAILMAAEKVGARQAGGRLSTPLMAVLDEAANVCRWRELPDVYSHYGSRGIIMSSFFQSWAQGVEAFGENGMSKLWSAANIRVAGAGLAEDKFLSFLSSLIGDHDVTKRSSSTQTKGRSVTTSIQRERILDIADLTAMPRGRAVMLASGMPAALVKLDHYSTSSFAQQVDQSRTYYEGLAVKEGHAASIEVKR
jgi:type IV secretory pathway TraG/TraD family ATPase VirD4